MSWDLTGQWLATCSCKSICACVIGPFEPDQGWCSGAFVFDVRQGHSDGVDLSNTRAAITLDLPGDFMGGNGTARLYLDEASTPEQRRELEAILSGQKGGAPAAIAAVVAKSLPTQTTRIKIEQGDNPLATVGDVGMIRLEPVKDHAGRQARLVHAPAFMAFNIDSAGLANAKGSRWADPELRSWESLGNGDVTEFAWSS